MDELSAGHRDIYLATHNTRKRQTSMTTVGFEPSIKLAAADPRLRPCAHGIGCLTNRGTNVFFTLMSLCKLSEGRLPEIPSVVSVNSFLPHTNITFPRISFYAVNSRVKLGLCMILDFSGTTVLPVDGR
jgi:hypothetical protein